MKLLQLTSVHYAFMALAEVFGGSFQSTLTYLNLYCFVTKGFPPVFEEENRRNVSLFYMIRETIIIGKNQGLGASRSTHFLILSQFLEYWSHNLQNKVYNFPRGDKLIE